MKITELDLTKDGKKYKSIGKVFKVKGGNLIDVERNTYLGVENISIAELLEMDFEEIKETKNPYERVDSRDIYYVVNVHGVIGSFKDVNDLTDKGHFNNLNYFNNKNYAEYIAFRETLMRKIDRFAWEHNAKVIDWNDCFTKYYIVFDHEDNELRIDVYYTVQSSNDIYFSSREIAEKAIEELKDDLIKLYTWKFDF